MGIKRWPRIQRPTVCYKYSTSTSSKAYSATLLLPKTPFPLRADPSVREKPFRQRTSEDLYKWQRDNLKRSSFILLDGPPYANGSLHMGHALNKILKDIINRFCVLVGIRVHYVPGWDCHGLPIENKALKDMRANHETLSLSKIREVARQTAERQISIQKAEFRQLGIMADWDSPQGTYRTMDHDYQMRQLGAFQELVKKGLIYRQYRPVYYSPSSRTALAEAELVYVDNHVSNSVYVSYECVFETIDPDIRYILRPHIADNGVSLLIWTTTPWTLPTNMAIAVNHTMEYVMVKCAFHKDIFVLGKSLLPSLRHILGQEVVILHTCIGNELSSLRYRGHFQSSNSQYKDFPVILSYHVTPTSGTGLVHCAPAHGIEDYQDFLHHNKITRQSGEKTLLCLVGPEGTFSEQAIAEASWLDPSIGSQLVGKPVLKEGSRQVVEILDSTGHLIGQQKIHHRYPYDWKTNTPVVVIPTSQWFADLSPIKEEVWEALKNIQFVPEVSRTRLTSFVDSRSEWCISRQRPWGVPIPALINELTNEAVLSPESLEFIISILNEKGMEHWWNGPVEDFVNPHLKTAYPNVSWQRGNDTMDVWFDSGTAWTLLRDVSQSRNQDAKPGKFHVCAHVCLEGSDQHRGWFQSLLLTAIGASSNVNNVHKPENIPGENEDVLKDNENILIRPYKTLVTHGFVLDPNGKKMSKSLGNVISPMTVVAGGSGCKAHPPYGADVLRLWAATIDYTRDTSLSQTVLEQTAELLRKIRNSARFLLGNIPKGVEDILPGNLDFSLADMYVMRELYLLEQTSIKAYSEFRFSQVVTSLDRFVKITLSSLYLDITKDTLYADAPDANSRQCVLWVMNNVLQTMTSVMAPILPHLAEEIYHYRRLQDGLDDTGTNKSVFTDGWKSHPELWDDRRVARDMDILLSIRDTVLALLERARTEKLIRNSLEASVDIIVPDGLVNKHETVNLLFVQESFLKTLFIVSDARVVEERRLKTSSFKWTMSQEVEADISDLDTSDPDLTIKVLVRPSEKHKCPRCWTYTRDEHEELCERCNKVLQNVK